MAGALLSDGRRGKNTRHSLTGLLRQSVFGRVARHEDVNDGFRAIRPCAGLSATGETAPLRPARWDGFEMKWLASEEILVALRDSTLGASGSSSK